MEPKDFVRALRNGWWLLLAGALLIMAVAGGLTLRTTPLYSTSMQLFVSATETDSTATAYQGNLFSQERVASYVELLKGDVLASRVIKRLHLPDSPTELASSIDASALPNTVLLSVTVTRPSPTQACDIATALGSAFTQRVAELETSDSNGRPTVKVTVSEPPQLPTSPTSPDPVRNLLAGLMVGLLLGALAAVLRERLDNTVKDADDIAELTGAGIIGTLMEDPALASSHVVTDEDGYSETGEAYRQIRTNLQFLQVDNPARTIVVTSSLPGEGKTTVAVNLAVVLAQAGARVALIEADLRRPRVTRYLGLISGAGLSNVLAGSASYEELTQPYGEGRLTVLAAGPMPPNPSEMLGSENMRHLLAEAQRLNEYVIIDAPPLLPVTDGALLAVASDGALLVAHHGKTTRAQLKQAAEALARIEARVLGVVLNRVPAKAAESYGYGYGYSYDAISDMQLTGQFPAIVDRPAGRRRGPQTTKPIAHTGGGRR